MTLIRAPTENSPSKSPMGSPAQRGNVGANREDLGRQEVVLMSGYRGVGCRCFTLVLGQTLAALLLPYPLRRRL